MASARIVLASAVLADYPEGGGHWSWFLQYPLGLRALGHEVFILEVLSASGDEDVDRRRISLFFARLEDYGLRERAALLLEPAGQPFSLDSVSAYGSSVRGVRELASSADVVWNLCGSVDAPLISLFRRRALIDTDPGVFQLSAEQWDMDVPEHDVLLTVGTNVGRRGCEVPTLDRTWHTFRPFVHLPAWPMRGDPGPAAPFTSVTHWNWENEVFEWRGGLTNTSKRTAYLRYLDLPHRAGRPFELAANIHPEDDTGDREVLLAHGWELVHPEHVAGTPEDYREYIQRSRAELACAKAAYVDLRTGWLSDRSVCYLASGRPVICEDTGLPGEIPTGRGLLTFSNTDEALTAIREVDHDYQAHSRAARELAETLFDAQMCLAAMVELCV